VAGREFVDFHARDRRVETPVEVIEALQCGEFGGGGAARDLALLPHVDLVVQDQLQEFGMMEPAGGGFLVPAESVLCERGHGLVGAQIQVDALRGESALKPAVITARRGSSRLAGPGEKPAVGLVAGFCGGAYRFTVSRSTSRSRAIRRRDQPRCTKVMIACCCLTSSRFVAPVAAHVAPGANLRSKVAGLDPFPTGWVYPSS